MLFQALVGNGMLMLAAASISSCAVQGTFSAHFKAPDVYGVFKFVIEHKCLGYSSIEQSVQIPVRPFRHDEFERFLSPAYPYYAGAFSVMAAFFLLGLTFLYSK